MDNKIVLYWPIAYSGNAIGKVGWDLEVTGWKGFVEKKVLPAIAWAQRQKLRPTILLMHPFNQYNLLGEAMHLDGYDISRRQKRTKLTTGFSSAWLNIPYPKVAYLGGMELTPRLKNLSTKDKCACILRNVKPILAGGFQRIFLDYAENALSYPYKGINTAQDAARSCDTLTLAYLDELFGTLTGIEAAPRKFPEFAGLHFRDIIMQDTVFQHRYGGLKNWEKYAEEFKYGNRHSNHANLGYDLSCLRGEIWRTLPYSDNLTAIRELASNIWNQGHIPAISPGPFVNLNEMLLTEFK